MQNPPADWFIAGYFNYEPPKPVKALSVEDMWNRLSAMA